MSPEEAREAVRQGLLNFGQTQDLRPLDPVVAATSAVAIPRGTRCGVCSAGQEIVVFVNRLIVGGATYAEAHRALAAVNEARIALGESEISYQSVFRHGRDHLPAKAAAIREIVERRARAAQLDTEEGTANIITVATYAEAMMTKAMQDLSEVPVTAAEGLQAAKFLNQLMQAERGNVGVEAAFAELGYLIAAVKEAVPQQYWAAITTKIEEKRTGGRVIDGSVDEFDPGDQPDDDDFSPADDGDDDL